MWCWTGSRRSVYIQSTLKRRPGYRTLERDLIQMQQQQLFQIFVVVSLRKSSQENTYSPEITQQFPKMVSSLHNSALFILHELMSFVTISQLNCNLVGDIKGFSLYITKNPFENLYTGNFPGWYKASQMDSFDVFFQIWVYICIFLPGI